ncbi:McrC family protein [Nitrosomonas mobilis]|uniref:5-methylcytosine restriction system component-like protein n=1 Tax=Nitrosomonas mobilis TaxID=51642 RepID=A0A1G5SF52_9PROT|nr:McrC family protein [Nitrosomonas mobilis]SCZ85049.1 5-methylcytosine restriction system component-like protein [Nitrosomonas mobilis]
MTIQVREYATLTCDTSRETSMDLGVVSQATFDWLLELQQSWKGRADLLSIEGKTRLKLCSYAGYLQSPHGEAIEILPKTEYAIPTGPERLRRLLHTMLRSTLGLKHREAGAAELLRSRTPLHEWVIRQFLKELADLVRRGLRFDYRNVEEQCRFIRGQLDMTRQIRQTPEKATHFHVRHAEFSPQRLENRLIKTALDIAFKLTKDSDNWRLANTLSHQLVDIEPINQPLRQLGHWHHGKMMQSYSIINPWCRLLLEQLNPNFQKGKHKGIALLFPMEQLFERYLKACLRQQLAVGAKLTPQVSRRHLLSHAPDSAEDETVQNWFVLKPDFLIEQKGVCFVLDAKWKLLDQRLSTSEHKYGIKQADLYQMFAYGQKYLDGKGQLMLIYPKHNDFERPLPVFRFNDQLSLWCVPLDLYTGKLIEGDWLGSFDCFQFSAA